jgi:cell shape-determining protein MreD
MTAYIAAFDVSQMLWLIPALVLAPSFVILMVCIWADAPTEKKLLAMLGVVLGSIYVAQITANYAIQLMAI